MDPCDSVYVCIVGKWHWYPLGGKGSNFNRSSPRGNFTMRLPFQSCLCTSYPFTFYKMQINYHGLSWQKVFTWSNFKSGSWTFSLGSFVDFLVKFSFSKNSAKSVKLATPPWISDHSQDLIGFLILNHSPHPVLLDHSGFPSIRILLGCCRQV